MNELYVLEWSQKQKCFHIETLDEMQKRNFAAFRENRNTEYIPIMLCESRKDAHKFADKFMLIDCESVKAMNRKWGNFKPL